MKTPTVLTQCPHTPESDRPSESRSAQLVLARGNSLKRQGLDKAGSRAQRPHPPSRHSPEPRTI